MAGSMMTPSVSGGIIQRATQAAEKIQERVDKLDSLAGKKENSPGDGPVHFGRLESQFTPQSDFQSFQAQMASRQQARLEAQQPTALDAKISQLESPQKEKSTDSGFLQSLTKNLLASLQSLPGIGSLLKNS